MSLLAKRATARALRDTSLRRYIRAFGPQNANVLPAASDPPPTNCVPSSSRTDVSTSRTPLNFPCVDAHAQRQQRLESNLTLQSQTEESGPEPPYARPNPSSYKIYKHKQPFNLIYSSEPLSSFNIAYETWGTMSPKKDNVILLHTGLSASSHAASTESNPAPGWWQNFIGPGKALDTNEFFIICTNVLGGCYGSTGPSSLDPASVHSPEGSSNYATKFPVLSIFDMVRAQFHLLDELGVDKLYASVGSSMGAMQSLAAGWLHPSRVGKVVSISGTGRSSPSSIAMRFAQRSGQSQLVQGPEALLTLF